MDRDNVYGSKVATLIDVRKGDLLLSSNQNNSCSPSRPKCGFMSSDHAIHSSSASHRRSKRHALVASLNIDDQHIVNIVSFEFDFT
jgi:hypothetical protein